MLPLLLALAAQPIEDRPTVAEIMAAAPEAAWVAPRPEDTLYIETPQGRIVVAMVPELAPAHAAQLRRLVREGYYDGLSFYRVPIGFVAQGGDVDGERDLGAAAPALPAEFEAPLPEGLTFTPLGMDDPYAPEAGFVRSLPAARDPATGTAWLAHCAGALAFGREEGRDTASTEIYVTLQPQRYLDRNLTVVGRVVWGFEQVDAITRNAPGNFGTMAELDRATPILSVRLASDVPRVRRTEVELLDSTSETFRQLIEARAARPSGFFYHRPGHVDLCQMPVPARLAPDD